MIEGGVWVLKNGWPEVYIWDVFLKVKGVEKKCGVDK